MTDKPDYLIALLFNKHYQQLHQKTHMNLEKYWSNIMQSAISVCPSGKEALYSRAIAMGNAFQEGPENKTYTFFNHSVFFMCDLKQCLDNQKRHCFGQLLMFAKVFHKIVLDYYKNSLGLCYSKE